MNEDPQSKTAPLPELDEMDLETAAALATDDEHSMTVWQAICRYPTACAWSFGFSLTIIMEAYDIALLGNLFAYPAFARQFGEWRLELNDYVISAGWQVGFTVAAIGGLIIGLLINGLFTERFGHRIMVMGGLILMSGFIFILFFAKTMGVLFAGEVLIGIPWGVFSIMGSIYSSEVVPLPLRGQVLHSFLLSFVNLAWIIGQLIAAGLLEGLVDVTNSWAYRIPFATQWVWPIPLFIMAYFAPDSPWWLVGRNRISDAEKSMARLSSNLTPEQIKGKVAMMVHTNNLEKSMHTEAGYLDCFKGTNLRRTEIACMSLAAQVLPGAAFAYNATYFFVQAGLAAGDAYKLNLGSIGIAFVATVGSWFLMVRVGRRMLINVGMGFLCITLLLIGCLTYANSPASIWAQAGLAMAWLGFYSLLIGPATFTVAAEISATRLRAPTVSLARMTYVTANFVANVVEPYLINPTEANLEGKTAFPWFGLGVLTLVWTLLRLPETKGRTYEELDMLFSRHIPAWKFTTANLQVAGEDDTPSVAMKLEGTVQTVEDVPRRA